MRATTASTCPACQRRVRPSQQISRHGSEWLHAVCRDALVERELILMGERFAGTRSEYHRRVKRRDY